MGLGKGPLFEAFISVISYIQESIFSLVVLVLIVNILPSGVVTLRMYLEKVQSLDNVLS